jgi:hypothetical protein
MLSFTFHMGLSILVTAMDTLSHLFDCIARYNHCRSEENKLVFLPLIFMIGVIPQHN